MATTQCPLVTAGLLKEDIQIGNLELTEKGREALADDVLRVDFLRIAGNCTTSICQCNYRDTPQLVTIKG